MKGTPTRRGLLIICSERFCNGWEGRRKPRKSSNRPRHCPTPLLNPLIGWGRVSKKSKNEEITLVVSRLLFVFCLSRRSACINRKSHFAWPYSSSKHVCSSRTRFHSSQRCQRPEVSS